MLKQVGTAFAREAVHRFIMTPGTAAARHAGGQRWLEYNRSMSEAPLLSGKRVAMLVEDEFEDRELTGPLEALRAAGATVTLIGPTGPPGSVKRL